MTRRKVLRHFRWCSLSRKKSISSRCTNRIPTCGATITAGGGADAGDGVHFGDLVATLCPDTDTANQALADLLATAATLREEP